MGLTKTLAKLANYAVKKWKATGGVLDLSGPIRRERLMKLVPVKEVWGICPRTGTKLNQLGIHTIWDLAAKPSGRIQGQFNIMVARTVMELNGIACFGLEEIAPDKQQIVCSRSFGQRVTGYDELASALANYCTRAAEKLRKQHSVTDCINVFIRTNPFNPQEPQYQRSASIRLHTTTQDTRLIISYAKQLLSEIFRSGFRYQKCGVQLGNLQPARQAVQLQLFDSGNKDDPELMRTMDRINQRFPKAIFTATTTFDKTWKAKTGHISPRYTTSWDELVVVKA